MIKELTNNKKIVVIKVAIAARKCNYCKEMMDFMFGNLSKCPQDEVDALLEFLRTYTRVTFRLYCELVFRLNDIKAITYKL